MMYSCLENPRDGGAWWAAVYGVAQNRIRLKRLGRGSSSSRLLRPWDFPGKNTGVGCRFLLQGIFPTQRSNLGLSYCGQTLYRLNHQGNPQVLNILNKSLPHKSQNLRSSSAPRTSAKDNSQPRNASNRFLSRWRSKRWP